MVRVVGRTDCLSPLAARFFSREITHGFGNSVVQHRVDHDFSWPAVDSRYGSTKFLVRVEESVAVLAHQFTRIDLGDLDSPDDVEATTVLDMVEKVREELALPFRSQLEEEKRGDEQTRRALADARAVNLAIKARAKAQTDGIVACLAGLVYGAFCLAVLVGLLKLSPSHGRIGLSLVPSGVRGYGPVFSPLTGRRPARGRPLRRRRASRPDRWRKPCFGVHPRAPKAPSPGPR